MHLRKEFVYSNRALMSPLTRARKRGAPMQAGIKYSIAGRTWPERCPTKIATTSPKMYTIEDTLK